MLKLKYFRYCFEPVLKIFEEIQIKIELRFLSKEFCGNNSLGGIWLNAPSNKQWNSWWPDKNRYKLYRETLSNSPIISIHNDIFVVPEKYLVLSFQIKYVEKRNGWLKHALCGIVLRVYLKGSSTNVLD